MFFYIRYEFYDDYYFKIDLESLKLNVEEFISLLIRNRIISILNTIIIEEKTKDKDFLVCCSILSFNINLLLLLLLLLLCFFFFFNDIYYYFI